MTESPLFRHESVKDALNYLFQEKKNKNESFSLRAWARRLGLKHPSFISDVLNGKKKSSPAFLSRILPFLELSQDEKDFLGCLCRLENCSEEDEAEFYLRQLRRIAPKKAGPELLDLDVLSVLTWYHSVLNEVFRLKDFKQDPKYLSQRLGGRISPSMIEIAIKDLVRLGLVKVDKNGTIVGAKDFRMSEPDPEQPPPPPVLWSMKERLDLASVQAAKLQGKEFLWKGVSFAVRTKDCSTIREAVRKFQAEIVEQFECQKGADEIFRLDCLFYRITQ